MLLWLLAGIVALIVLVAVFKFDPFLTFLLVSIGLGFATGLDAVRLSAAIRKGVGDTLGDLVLIIGFGAMLGKLVAESGAARRITDTLVSVFGRKYLPWGLALAGFIIGIPLFYNAGFVLVIPLIFSIATTQRLPVLPVALPMLAALSVAHGYLPPHPSPAAISARLGAELGKVLIYGTAVALPAIALAGPVFGSTLGKYNIRFDAALFDAPPVAKAPLPGLGVSLFTSLLPVFWLGGSVAFRAVFPESEAVRFMAEPFVGMLVSVLVAIWLLGTRRGLTLPQVGKYLEEAFKSAAPLLLIIAGAGVLKQVLQEGGLNELLGNQLKTLPMPPLVLGWLMAGVIRICLGSATIAGLTAAGMVAPLLAANPHIRPELMVLSVGAGSLMCSHLNDGGFWLFKEYFNLSIKETLLTWSVMETLVSIIGLLGILLFNAFG